MRNFEDAGTCFLRNEFAWSQSSLYAASLSEGLPSGSQDKEKNSIVVSF